MFQFPWLPSHELLIHSWMTRCYACRVPPFGYPRIVVCLRLPEAFRSLPRPSSALYAQAFTVRPSSFDHFAMYSRSVHGLSIAYFLLFKNCQHCFYLFCLSDFLARNLCFTTSEKDLLFVFSICYLLFSFQRTTFLKDPFQDLSKLDRNHLPQQTLFVYDSSFSLERR